MSLADNFGMFRWELSNRSFHLSWENIHMFQILSLFSVSEEQYSKTATYRINDTIHSARQSAGNLIIEIEEGKNVWGYNFI